ncbi:Uncharacterised protein [uncultured archaeon]|nr:Uncharacterised protein [uncultured archaeon]
MEKDNGLVKQVADKENIAFMDRSKARQSSGMRFWQMNVGG